MQLTVLGSCASYPSAGRACAGHLLRSGGTAVMLDCGNGTLANLGKVMEPTELSAVLITHPHVDHFADVFALQAALRYAPSGPLPPLPLYLPAGLFDRMLTVLTGHGADELREAFEVHELVAGQRVTIGDLAITPHHVDHVDETFAFVAEDGGRLCYTSDTRFGRAVLDAAAGAGVLLAEATLPPEYAGLGPHMTPREAGDLARESGAHTVVLTHLWPTVDRDAAAAEVRERFAGRVIVAEELDTIDID